MKFSILILMVFLFSGCLVIDNEFSKIPPGIWRATLQLTPEEQAPLNADNRDDRVENRANVEINPGELPFLFEVKYITKDSFIIEIINGDERIVVDDIQFGHTKARVVDTIRINFPVYDTYIIGTFRERFIHGKWVVNYKENYSIPFKAEFGRDYRFTDLEISPFALVTGSSVRSVGGFSTSSDGGAQPGTDWMSAGVGLRFVLDNGFSIRTDYEGAFFRSSVSQHYGSLKVGYEW